MKECKYGVILYQDTDNIGDDIQTYAAYQKLPRVDYVINREKMSEFIPDKKEVVKVIANGWFNHNKQKFLFSPYIYPLLIAMHFSKNDLILEPGHQFLEGYAKKHLMQFGPLGCRDKNTEKDLKKMGYETYFSSCLTLTLDQIGKKKTEDYICAVDMNPKILEHLKKITKKEIKNVSHWLIFDEKEKKLSYEEKQKIIEEYTAKSFEERKEYVKNNSKLSFKKRMQNVEELLKSYQNASLVITDRIHVALPCLALETPVLLIYYDKNEDRVKTFKEFITNCSEDDFLKYQEKDLLKIKNSEKYKKYRISLNDKVQDFLNDTNYQEYEKTLIEPTSYKKEVIDRINYLEKLYITKINSDKRKITELNTTIKDLNGEIARKEKQYSELQDEYQKAEKVCIEYNMIRSSRSWKLIGNYYQKKVNKNK